MKLFIRRLSLIVLLSGVFNVIIAQDVQVKSVKLMSNDNSAVSKPRKDLNDTNLNMTMTYPELRETSLVTLLSKEKRNGCI